MAEPIYAPCNKATSIRMPNGAYSFAKCTLLTCDGKRHEGEHRFALSLYVMLNDKVKL